MRNTEYLNITGTGYFVIRWEIAWFNRIGQLSPPTWTGLDGKLFHVASGGGRRLTDAHDSTNATYTWMGPQNKRITLPEGYQQMWQNEFYYLDGCVTLHENEGAADYNLGFSEFLCFFLSFFFHNTIFPPSSTFPLLSSISQYLIGNP